MTEEKQRIAIAEACGWVNLGWVTPGHMWQHPDGRKDYVKTYWPPNYLSDLNAMHEAESILKNNEQKRAMYVMYLSSLVKVEDWRRANPPYIFFMCRATAAQRAEAFLRTLNLWKS